MRSAQSLHQVLLRLTALYSIAKCVSNSVDPAITGVSKALATKCTQLPSIGLQGPLEIMIICKMTLRMVSLQPMRFPGYMECVVNHLIVVDLFGGGSHLGTLWLVSITDYLAVAGLLLYVLLLLLTCFLLSAMALLCLGC